MNGYKDIALEVKKFDRSLAADSYRDRKYAPECCRNCRHIASDSDGFSTTYDTFFYCELGIFLPVKKKSCKRQEKR